MSDVDDVYEDRNLAGVALVVSRYQEGDLAGWYVDEDTEAWPVVWAEMPTDEISYHVPPERRELLEASPLPNERPPGGYDGYTREDKNRRLEAFVRRTGEP
ncbi:hypothetical protein G3I44_16430 [Halogeometricum borinquense]|uniref:Uncharacterized protein n=1 Tax=Halogeometricum borinquense TaxID=60847 RepID=A0A6C0US05_9EURY|nr:hypothetical protein [Halogeometricum borinquense]QIB75728.1 hypothetical protein G3I44_16430 [Halogeometricum borinquense]